MTSVTIRSTDPNALLALSGLRVVALEQAVAGPFCSRQLADMGADVIKVERPDGGDFARHYDRALNGLSAHFAWLNRGKRSITLDLKQSRDLAICGRLINRADIFIHNLVPGAVERLGFGYDVIAVHCPRLIWCGISGFGSDGPYRERKSYDLLVQGEAGVMSLTGTPESPAKVGISIADIASGLYSYSSILAALINRGRTGRGERIDISMLESLTEWVTPAIYVWQGTGQAPARAGMRHNMIVPYGVYACADGSINFAIQNDREWRRFCAEVLEIPELADDRRFVTNEDRLRNRQELETLLEAHFCKFSKAELLERLACAEIANGAMNEVPDVAGHAQLAARNRWTNVASPVGTIPALIPPHNLAHAPSRMGAVPGLGEHSAEILAELKSD
jgi:crotonobetainyl-CoA:carnitine CoA-transferase CaiB-like acyl-CoA transferase